MCPLAQKQCILPRTSFDLETKIRVPSNKNDEKSVTKVRQCKQLVLREYQMSMTYHYQSLVHNDWLS